MTYACRARDFAMYLLDHMFNVADSERGENVYAIHNFEECIEQFHPSEFSCKDFLGLQNTEQVDSFFCKATPIRHFVD